MIIPYETLLSSILIITGWLILSIMFVGLAAKTPALWVAAILIVASLPSFVIVEYYVPVWKERARLAAVQDQRFDHLCRTKATIELPVKPEPAIGLVWVEPDAAQKSFLSKADGPSDFVAPSRGDYVSMAIYHTQWNYTTKFWDPESSYPGNEYVRGEARETPVSRFQLRIESAVSSEDLKLHIDGVETTIRNVDTKEVVARQVAFGKFDLQSRTLKVVCPMEAGVQDNCSKDGCSVKAFVKAAVPPIPPNNLSRAFHLYRGIGTKPLHCGHEFHIGPGITPQDIEWWGDWKDGKRLNLRVKGSNDHVYCDESFNPGSFDNRYPKVYFAETGKSYSIYPAMKMMLNTKHAGIRSTLSDTLDIQ